MSVSQEQQPVVRFRVPSQSFHDELKQAALDRGETPSIFIRRAIADRLYPPQADTEPVAATKKQRDGLVVKSASLAFDVDSSDALCRVCGATFNGRDKNGSLLDATHQLVGWGKAHDAMHEGRDDYKEWRARSEA